MVSRRQFLSGLAATPVISMLGTSGVTASEFTDYKALVCVFLFGGNDGFNTLIPTNNAGYDEYKTARPSIALPQNDLLSTNIQTGSELTLGLHPAMSAFQKVVNRGDAAAIANCGVLVEPATKEQLKQGTRKQPPFLFSHNSQQSEWQRAWAGNASTLGWAGRLMDQLSGTGEVVSPMFSTNGNVQWLNGEHYTGNLLKSTGLPKIGANNNSERKASFEQVLGLTPISPFGKTFNRVKSESVVVRDALAKTLEASPVESVFTEGKLEQQLHMVARLIKSNQILGHKRQIFFVGLGGFDTHDNQLNKHAELMAELSEGLAKFQDSMQSGGLSNQVTTLTMSDFGRRLASNGTGTDHGWGSNHWVMGGAVKGGQLIGQWPSLTLDGPDDFNKGRMIPTTSVEQIGATLAKWMGATQAQQLAKVFPNLNNFDNADLGFMNV